LVGDAGQRDSLLPESSNELQSATQSLEVAAQRQNLALIEVGTPLEAGDVRLVDARLCRNIRLRLACCVSKDAECEVNAPLRAKATSQDTDRLHVVFSAAASWISHAFLFFPLEVTLYDGGHKLQYMGSAPYGQAKGAREDRFPGGGPTGVR